MLTSDYLVVGLCDAFERPLHCSHVYALGPARCHSHNAEVCVLAGFNHL